MLFIKFACKKKDFQKKYKINKKTFLSENRNVMANQLKNIQNIDKTNFRLRLSRRK